MWELVFDYVFSGCSSCIYLWIIFTRMFWCLLLWFNDVLGLAWMCDECTWHHKTCQEQLYCHLAVKLCCIVGLGAFDDWGSRLYNLTLGVGLMDMIVGTSACVWGVCVHAGMCACLRAHVRACAQSFCWWGCMVWKSDFLGLDVLVC